MSGAVLASALPFPKAGIAVSFLEDFVDQHGGRSRFTGLTTTQVFEDILKQVTFTAQTSYCEHMELHNHPKVGTATVFVSHAWQFHFLDVVNALQYHFRDNLETIIWFDLFSTNQHRAVSLDFDWWCGTFMSAIEEFGNTLIILAPASNPIPLTRGWCVFELYATIKTNSNLQVAMSHKHLLEFFTDLEKDVPGTIDKMLGIINASKSQCFKPEDKERIFEAIESTVGFSKINGLIFDRLRDWVVEVVQAELGSRRAKLAKQQLSESDIMDYVNILAELYRHQGKYVEAEPLFVKCLETRRTVLGAAHPNTLSSMNGLAALYWNQGNYAKAEPLWVEALGKMKTADHPHKLVLMNNLGNLYKDQGKHAEAEQLLVESLKGMKTLFRVAHPETLLLMNNLGILYRNQGKWSEAEPLLVECLETRKIMLGADHPHTLVSMNNLANLYLAQKKYAEALPLYVKCLETQKIVLGVAHPETLQSMSNLANLYDDIKKYTESERLYVECLEKMKSVLGVDHKETLSTMSNFAVLYINQGKHAEAKPLLEDCLERRKTVLGENHPETIMTQCKLWLVSMMSNL